MSACLPHHLPVHLPLAGSQLGGHTAEEIREALQAANLKAGAICLRYEKEHQAGAFTHPEEALRRKAIEITKEGARWALALGAGELVVWSAFDGYDYNNQVDYHVLWQRVVDAFVEICDEFPTLRVSLEFKPTDENTRFFAVPSTGAALLLAHEINRPNFGLTLDIGHMIMAGENPAQSVALVGKAGKLFGVQESRAHGDRTCEVRLPRTHRISPSSHLALNLTYRTPAMLAAQRRSRQARCGGWAHVWLRSPKHGARVRPVAAKGGL